MTKQRTLPSTKEELQTHLERRAPKELKSQQVAAETAGNKATPDQDRAIHEAAMAAHIGQQGMATTLAARAKNEEAIVAGVAAHATALGAGDTVHMHD